MANPWTWLRGLLARRQGEDPVEKIRYVVPYAGAGVRLTPDEALSVGAVWACVDAIAKAIASCRWNVFEPLDNGGRKVLPNDPVSWLLNTRANSDMTAVGFREAMLYTAIPHGNAYAEIVRDGGGRVAALWPLAEERVTPRRDPNTWELFYEYRQPDGSTVRLEQRQVFHLRGPGVSGLLGDNLVARAIKSISAAAAQERFSGTFFGNGANPGGVLEVSGKMDPTVLERLKNDFAEKRQGPENAHKPLILEGGMKWTPTAVEPQKSQLVEARQFSVEEICRWFGVPPHKVQHLLRSTFSNIEHQSIEFVRDALTPWARRLEQEADFKLFPQMRGPWRYTSIDLAPLTFGDAYSRAQAHAIWRQNGIMSANEIRAAEGLNEAGPNGNVLLVQSNLTTVERLMAPPPAALPAGEPADVAEEEPEPTPPAPANRVGLNGHALPPGVTPS